MKAETRKIRAVIFLLSLFLLVSRVSISASPLEYEVKAAFLLKFVEYVEWPDSLQNDDLSSYTVGIVGKDPFGTLLPEKIVSSETPSKTFNIIRVNNSEEACNCQILFFSNGESQRILDKVKKMPVLTVGEGDIFLYDGGVISFIMEDNRVRFLVSMKNANQAGLKINSRLLRLARKVLN
ncbi:MAG: YfiR family protein [Candidatus Riflebacteria bacterium]|nr:YfiR family protein [Candidatus Riflebacteria bacterium]